MVDPGEEFTADMKPVLRIDDFKEIFTRVSKSTAQALIDTNFNGDHDGVQIDILEKLLSQISYYILDEPLLQELYSKCKANLANALASKQDLT